MKKTFILLTLFALAACGKKSTPTPTPDVTIEYKFTTNTSASYDVSYLGPDNTKVNTTFTGTSFSKTIITNKSTGFKNAVLFIGLTSPDKVISGTADILVDNKESNHVDLTFNTTNGENSTDLTFGATVFK